MNVKGVGIESKRGVGQQEQRQARSIRAVGAEDRQGGEGAEQFELTGSIQHGNREAFTRRVAGSGLCRRGIGRGFGQDNAAGRQFARWDCFALDVRRLCESQRGPEGNDRERKQTPP